MIKMKRFFSLLLITIIVLSLGTIAKASAQELHTLSVASEVTTNDINILATQHLENTKVQFATNPSILGFSSEELLNSSLGNSFTLYVFDKDGQVISDYTQVYPVIYGSQIVGILEVYNDSSSMDFIYTFGKSYADELNAVRYRNKIDVNKDLIIGRISDKLFVTDTVDVDILLDKAIDSTNTISTSELKNICNDLKQSESTKYETITELTNRSAKIQVIPEISERTLPNPLPVPHVKQTSVCGVAAWAAVLNYRFGTSYTNASLESAMANVYTNGSGGIPNMTDYKSYANDQHNGGCSVAYSPLSFTSTKNQIKAGRPIMGSWYSGSESNKSWHAIVITGYVEKSSSNYTYTVKNPWHTYAQIITVANSSNVVYPDSGYTWKLSQSVY